MTLRRATGWSADRFLSISTRPWQLWLFCWVLQKSPVSCIIFSFLSHFPPVCALCAPQWSLRPDNPSSLPQYPSHNEDNMRWLPDTGLLIRSKLFCVLLKPFTALFECWLHLLDVRSLKTMFNGDKHRHYTALAINVWQNCFESCFHNYTPEVTSWTSWCLAAAHKTETVGSST